MMNHLRIKFLLGAAAAGTAVAAITPMILIAQSPARLPAPPTPPSPPLMEIITASPQPAASPPAPVSIPTPIPELVAVGFNTHDNSTWWKPDGSPLGTAPANPAFFGGLGGGQNTTSYDVLLRWPAGTQSDAMILPRGGSYFRLGDLEYITISAPSAESTAVMPIQIASGPWLELLRSAAEGELGRTMDGPGYAVVSGDTLQAGNDVVKIFADNLNEEEHRFSALDKAGRTVSTVGGTDAIGTGNATLHLYSPHFKNVNLKDLSAIRCDIRHFDAIVIYQNIALRPDTHPDFKIATGTSKMLILDNLPLRAAPVQTIPQKGGAGESELP